MIPDVRRSQGLDGKLWLQVKIIVAALYLEQHR